MLRLKDIKKDYKVADSKVHALKGINVSFRENEFVAILGPSGCGKTTLLNLVGGLDHYTSGNLFINGKSTRHFKDRDWDVYRNHRVGFIFQSYNLIPHQTVLGNVELALTIAGMPKAERIAKAKNALDKVGLSDQYYKRPNQLSGGQCQRVAIARAIVNDPEILLADEPTGALDTETSIQIMDIVKEIAKERLVIMVTHNPEIADRYATRIIRLLDGELISDTNPFSEKDEVKLTEARNKKVVVYTKEETAANSKKERAKMSFWTAFRLSLNNLFSKRSRTILTSIAGSIGIIGVSLVLSLSYGIQSYITSMQDDMLSGNPIKISKSAFDLGALMDGSTFSTQVEVAKEVAEGHVAIDSLVDMLVKRANSVENMMISNTLTQEYVDFIKAIPSEHAAAIFLDQGIDVTNNIYTDFTFEGLSEPKSTSISAAKAMYTSILEETDYASYASLITSLSDTFMQAPNSEEYLLSQYNIKHGKFATGKNEVMIVLEKGSLLTDLLLTQLGYFSQDEFINMINKASEDENYDSTLDRELISYDELLNKSFDWYPNDTIYERQTDFSKMATFPFTYKPHADDSFVGKEELKIVGILEPNEDIAYGALRSGFFYTEALVEHMLLQNYDSEISKILRVMMENIEGLDGFYGEIGSVQDPAYPDDPTKQIPAIKSGIKYDYTYSYENTSHTGEALVGNAAGGMLGGLFGGSTYVITAHELGAVTLPFEISIYPVDFDHKDFVTEYLDQWNQDLETEVEINGVVLPADREQITYTDNLEIIISLINTLINIVTIALVGFTSLALVVSCVMIAIITYVSVVERIKEIGVIRSLGGRKKDVSHLFNAETFIIGLASGVIGVAVTYLVSGLINLIVRPSIGLGIAKFPIHYALIMIAISFFLTVISGLIPSKSAAKKDPVVALRSE